MAIEYSNIPHDSILLSHCEALNGVYSGVANHHMRDLCYQRDATCGDDLDNT